MASSVTNVPFSPSCQTILRDVAARNVYSSRYWVTRPQSSRSCNAIVLPNAKGTTIYLEVEEVIPLKALTKSEQRRILDEHPPYFGSGVGILSDRMKWRAVTAERMIRLLNKGNDDCALFVDVRIAEKLKISFSRKDVLDVKPASSIVVYNAQQLDDPYKGEPQRGIALNAITGKRMGQPAHDILLGVGILRGYTSPMWVSERQLKYLNIEVKPSALDQGVAAPNMVGMIVPLSVLPISFQERLLVELKASHRDAFGNDLFFIYNVNGWEVTRSRALVRNMAAISDSRYPFHFVNLLDLRWQKRQYAKSARCLMRLAKPIGATSLSSENHKKEQPDEKDNHLVVQTMRYGGKTISFFFAEDATLRRYYNACCMTKPYLVVPSVRPVAILNGKLIGRRDEAILRAFSLKHKLSSPIWLTEHAASRLGVYVLQKYKSKYVTIGRSAMGEEVDAESDSTDGFYNIQDFSEPEDVLSLFPKVSQTVHFMLDSKWRPVLGKQQQEYLTSQKRETPLWVSVNECLMSGFEPLPGARMLTFPGRTKAKGGVSQQNNRLYNSQFTSDPVRVIGLSTMLVRPQGLSL